MNLLLWFYSDTANFKEETEEKKGEFTVSALPPERWRSHRGEGKLTCFLFVAQGFRSGTVPVAVSEFLPVFPTSLSRFTHQWIHCVDRKIVATGAFFSFSLIIYQPGGSFMLFPLYLSPGTGGQYPQSACATLSQYKQFLLCAWTVSRRNWIFFLLLILLTVWFGFFSTLSKI